ncbi:alpha/beta hydrolase family protein [Paenibacillus sp. FSL R7-0345]|uniref:alpha/beta hydrolase n=1 Tax=Paenibacillus sp. FSL R7-0345 TaxID=2954535 RepID=UPI00315AE424
MAYMKMSFFSETLGMATEAGVMLPLNAPPAAERDGKFPVLYLLHGLGGDHTEWTRHSAIERYAENRGLALVLPRADRSYYTDMKQGGAYFTYLSEELPRLIQRAFAVSDRREDTFVAGISMGGYGAFKLALRHPQRYAAAASLSGGLDIVRRVSGPNSFQPGEAARIFGPADELRGSGDDLFALAGRAAEAEVQPRFYQCCGTEDIMYDGNRAFLDRAVSAGLDISYEEGPGGHEWDYWDRQLTRILDWLPL